jgi:uncharacterized protein with NRDE domain
VCLILLAWRSHPDYPLVVAANRDEFFARPTAPAYFWADAPDVLAGRDLEAGGTWLGITRGGRFAALTNYRDPARVRSGTPSRGALVSGFLQGAMTPAEYLAHLRKTGAAYNGFNLVFGMIGGGAPALHCFSNILDMGRGADDRLAPGIYGLSNHLLDTPWPKVARGKSALAAALQALPEDAPLMALLRDERVAQDEELPRTGVSLEWERLLSAAFVRSPDYGTRSSTVLTVDRSGQVRFDEVSFDARAHAQGRVQHTFALRGEI